MLYHTFLTDYNTKHTSYNVTFDVAGLFSFTPLILKLIQVVKNKLGYTLPISSIYGCPPLVWNGGRIILDHYTNKDILTTVLNDVSLLHENKITPLLTFSNHMITNDELYDTHANKLLEYICSHQIDAQIRISSPLLEEYIRKYYPTLPINASVIKVEVENGKGKLDYYKQLETQFNKYVVHPDDNFNYDLLKSLNKSKAEILLNERCFSNCPQRTLHYTAIANIQKSYNKDNTPQAKVLAQCTAIPEIKQLHSNRRNISLSLAEFNELYCLGFRHFKLQGRIDNPYVFFYDMIRYTLQDEFLISQVYIPFCAYLQTYLSNKKQAITSSY